MKRLNQLMLLAGAAFALTLSPNNLVAQDSLPTAPPDNGGNATPPATPAPAAAPAATTAPAAGTDQGQGQGQGQNRRRNFDPAQMQQRMLERYKEVLEVNSDDEWAAMSPLVQKVMDARRDSLTGGFGGMRGMFGRNRGGDNNNNGGQPRQNPFAGTPMPEQEALQKAIDAKASDADMKAAIDKYVAARKTREAALQKAQDDLRAVLSVRQEAIASLNGLL